MISSVVCRFFFMFRFWGLAPKPNILNGPILGGHLIGYSFPKDHLSSLSGISLPKNAQFGTLFPPLPWGRSAT